MAVLRRRHFLFVRDFINPNNLYVLLLTYYSWRRKPDGGLRPVDKGLPRA